MFAIIFAVNYGSAQDLVFQCIRTSCIYDRSWLMIRSSYIRQTVCSVCRRFAFSKARAYDIGVFLFAHSPFRMCAWCVRYLQVIATMVFMWRGIINAVSERTNRQILRRAKKAMKVTAAVVKVSERAPALAPVDRLDWLPRHSFVRFDRLIDGWLADWLVV